MEYGVSHDEPNAQNVDLSQLRGRKATEEQENADAGSDDDLNALAEIVPDLKSRKNSIEHTGMNLEEASPPSGAANAGNPVEDVDDIVPPLKDSSPQDREEAIINRIDSLGMTSSKDKGPVVDSDIKLPHMNRSFIPGNGFDDDTSSDDVDAQESGDVNEVLYGGDYPQPDDVGSDQALSSDHSKPRPPGETDPNLGLPGDFQHMSSAQSLSTATQTHEVRMPMYLPTFKPATGCTNASDFIVRCFVARLRAGITVVKHGRSRWCKSRLRILHIHSDGRSLSWKPAQGEPTSSKRPPKLDLTTCLEVRHAWSPDPQNPMYTGTPILRQKCEAANAHKSFALIFPKRTVDITSVTADQCKVLMEGFSALCFRLQVAALAGKGKNANAQKMPEEEEVATTASVTLTNNSTLSPQNTKTAAAGTALARH